MKTKKRKLKIAILVRRFITTGGLERYAVEVANLLSLEHEVHIFTQEWHENEENKNIIIHKIPKIRKPSFVNMLVFSYFTAKYLDNTFDIVHSHERVFKFDVLTIHIPCFKTFITQEEKFWKKCLLWLGVSLSPRKLAYLWIEKKQFTYSDNRLLIAVSHKTQQNVQDNYPLPDNFFRLAYPAVDINFNNILINNTERDNKRLALGITENDIAILFVGTEFKRKGLDALMKGFALIKELKAKLIIAGGGKQDNYIALAKELNIEKDVIFLGLVKDVAVIYSLADIFILPTLSDPAAMSPLEAMASGVATIISSSKYAGIAECIKNNEALILENPDNPQEIAQALIKLSNSEYRKEIATKAKNLVNQLTWEKTTQQTLSTYYDVLEKRL